jgi:hypothetical protein
MSEIELFGYQNTVSIANVKNPVHESEIVIPV